MLTVRSVEVKPYVGAPINSPNDVKKAALEAANPASENNAFEAMFAAEMNAEGGDSENPTMPAAATPVVAPAEEMPIVSENVSEFTFVIEYVEIEKEADTSSEKNDESKKGE